MLENITVAKILSFVLTLRDFLWSGPLLWLFIGTGIYATWQLRGVQFRYLYSSLKKIAGRAWQIISGNKAISHINNDQVQVDEVRSSATAGDLSSMQALMTALAGAIGTGNITGIAVAVTSGGLGALFWMWVVALFGMATAYAESVLAIKFRQTNAKNLTIGGPMVTLAYGLKSKWLAAWFALCGAIAGLGYAMVQANSVIDAALGVATVDRLSLGIILSFAAGWVIIGGVKRVGLAATMLVPFMAVLYLAISVIVLAHHYDQIIPAFRLILTSALTPSALAGGALGTSVIVALQCGAQYGIFANEAGLGSLAIASSCAKIDRPEQQGFLAISGVFIATMVVCTITGLVIAVTGVIGTEADGGLLTGSALALLAFSSVSSVLPYFVMGSLLLFAFTTILAWAYYGEKCLEFLLGVKLAYCYRWLYIACITIGGMVSLELVWAFAHLANGLMAIPNLVAVICLVKLLNTQAGTKSALSN